MFDKLFQACLGQWTSGISPAALTTSTFSWLSQLAQSPGRLVELATYPAVHFQHCADKIYGNNRPGEEADPRFQAESWQQFPWHAWAENFCLAENWWRRATTEVPGLPEHVERTISFVARQMLDALSPSNFIATNPELFHETIRTGGKNILHGAQSAITDAQRAISGKQAPGLENFIVGKNLAITPGRVVFRNHLIELIQYARRLNPYTNNRS